jgi:hypothetical protein
MSEVANVSRAHTRTVVQGVSPVILVLATLASLIAAGAAIVVCGTNWGGAQIIETEIGAPLQYDEDYLEHYAKHVLGKPCEGDRGCR